MRIGEVAATMVLVTAGCGTPSPTIDAGERPLDASPDEPDAASDDGPPPDAAVVVVPVDAAIDPCTDGVTSGGETDVDCGGPACGACALGRACAIASDCANANCVAGTCAALAAVSFSDPMTYFSGFKPYFVRAGDLDGDGDVDLVVGNEQASAIAVFRNLGVSSGMFQRVAEYSTGAYPTGGEITDLDRDGIADVITADYQGDSVSVLLGRGAGAGYAPMAAVSYPTVADGETSNLALGDLDGDGILDVIACNPQRASASVFLGRADGTLAVAPPIVLGAVGTAEPYSVAIGDFDGDGAADAALADDRSGTVYIRLGNGDGTFAPAPLRPLIGGTRSHIMLARDMDGDGRLDLVIASRSSNTVSVLSGRGDGTFRPPSVTSTGAGTGPYSLAVADFDLDGIPDVATANYLSSTASVLRGRGDGTFDVISTGVVGGTSYGIAAGDFDGDGRPDLAIANAVSNTLAIVRNTSN